MYIARLQLKGFKSFGGSHDLPLSPGMTAIVGPNGSGKSNLLDALRWVLGDSHASKLRISRQGDLLFQGSVSCSGATEAEVSIQMREDARICAIKRRLTESGSISLVDGSRVTLSELDEAKARWQLSGDRFAFIGQGDVTEVIQQRPQARRMLLESLFGIDAYRKRRTEASDRLNEAREEYDRLRNFRAELSARRDEIAPAVAIAAAARGIMDALEEERRVLYWIRRAKNETLLAATEEEAAALRRELAMRESWRLRWERSMAFVEGSLAELSGARQSQVRELEETKNSLAGFTRTAYGYGAAFTSAKKRSSQIGDERASLASKACKLRADKDASDSEGASLAKELESARSALDLAEKRYQERRESIRKDKENRAMLNSARGEMEGEMTALKGRIRFIGSSLKDLSGKSADDTGGADAYRSIKKELEVIEKRHEALLDEQEEASSRHRDVYARLREVTVELQKNRRESSKLSGRLAELQEQAQAEVYPRPVQHVLSSARLGRLDAKPCAVIDAFVCPAELATAIEAFLGGRQFWILVNTMDEAGRCIDQLKKNQAGRATFLPLERSRPRRRDESYRLPPDRVTGWAMKLISPEKCWLPALEHLMGDLLIVEDYKLGQLLAGGGFSCPIATLDGDVFQPSGSISGGKAQKPGRAIEIKSALFEMERQAASARARVDLLTAQAASLEEEEASAAGKKEEISTAIRELALNRSALDARREEIARERARAKNERDSMMASLKQNAARYAECFGKKKSIDEELRIQGDTPGEPDADAKLFREIERLKSAYALLGEKQRSAFVLSERIISDLRAAERSLAELDEESASCEQEIMTNRANLTRLARRVSETSARKRALAAGMAEFSERYEFISARRQRRIARLDKAKAALAEAESKNASSKSKAEFLRREREELIQTWEEQYPYAGPRAVSEMGDIDPDSLRKTIRERDRELKALGEVDLGALSEDKSLRERTAYLGDQLDDVSRGMMELERLIMEADEQARTIFTDAMEEIDKKFDALFQQLFGGGDARLDFIEGASLWDSGVDVVARPPGKHPQSIAQLSGGEQSLSAIALLFASLEAAGCPIAVLDEVDAALDEVNLRRFADLAKEASGKRQIFVMTHRRVTMERADVLYGVTLAEPGLSQVIGVRVEDWA
ncbi:MAG: chromosome segregation protein SMC [Synergistaceae bacterium]|nr:chromosome segregation protein SMC [Synergistaceae bacterium]